MMRQIQRQTVGGILFSACIGSLVWQTSAMAALPSGLYQGTLTVYAPATLGGTFTKPICLKFNTNGTYADSYFGSLSTASGLWAPTKVVAGRWESIHFTPAAGSYNGVATSTGKLLADGITGLRKAGTTTLFATPLKLSATKVSRCTAATQSSGSLIPLGSGSPAELR
ncbi:MAG TPA: hypothetical protein V6D19_15525 [Stenomitos sp.]